MSCAIDYRSDTVTKPSPAMREAMAHAEVGDDMLGEDPTVNRLEEIVCDLTGMEAAVFAASGTQSNQMAVFSHTRPGDELLLESQSHIFKYEGGAPAVMSSVMPRCLDGVNGMLDIEHLEGQIHADNQHLTETRLLCLENTTNMGGGRSYPLDQFERVATWGKDNGLAVHLDGARLGNAVVSAGYSFSEICGPVDSVSICFSKGLGCPVGSILAGSAELIHRARRARKIFGGAMRQAGILAAAAIYALENNVERLADDHANALRLATGLAEIEGLMIDPEETETNLVFFDVDPAWGAGVQLSHRLKEHNVLIGAVGAYRMRACTHLDVSADDIETTLQVVRDVMAEATVPADATDPFAHEW